MAPFNYTPNLKVQWFSQKIIWFMACLWQVDMILVPSDQLEIEAVGPWGGCSWRCLPQRPGAGGLGTGALSSAISSGTHIIQRSKLVIENPPLTNYVSIETSILRDFLLFIVLITRQFNWVNFGLVVLSYFAFNGNTHAQLLQNVYGDSVLSIRKPYLFLFVF